MEKLKAIVGEAIAELEGVIPEDQRDSVAKVIEAAVIKGMLEAHKGAVDCCNRVGGPDQDMAHKIATEIKQKNDALIANLSAMY